jgi:GAF domain-containing protein
MAENLHISSGGKEEVYQTLLPQIEGLITGETNIIANLANISSALAMTFKHLWVGFYLKDANHLVLGPFQGPIACTRILKGKGVCGQSWLKEETIIVKNVNDFPNHISCSSASVSEIVVPVFKASGDFFGVLDIDSSFESQFDEVDKNYLEQIVSLISKTI